MSARKLLKFLILFDNTNLLYFPGQFLSGRVLVELEDDTPALGNVDFLLSYSTHSSGQQVTEFSLRLSEKQPASHITQPNYIKHFKKSPTLLQRYYCISYQFYDIYQLKLKKKKKDSEIMEIMQHKLCSYTSKTGNQIQQFIAILPHRVKSQIHGREQRTNCVISLCVLYQISGRKTKSYIIIRLEKKILSILHDGKSKVCTQHIQNTFCIILDAFVCTFLITHSYLYSFKSDKMSIVAKTVTWH